jgi:hypothetical protein
MDLTDEANLKIVTDFVFGVEANDGGVLKASLGKIGDDRREGGRKEEGLAGVGSAFEQVADLLAKAELEEAVGLVKHKGLKRGERERGHLVEMME